MSKATIAVVDYGLGNVKSITNGFRKIGVESILTRDPTVIHSASGCVLPGVGSFTHGMKMLRRYDLIATLEDFVRTKKPLLGICLGMQLLFDESDEFVTTEGLGFVPGRVERLGGVEGEDLKLPHVCWNEVQEPHPRLWSGSIMQSTSPEASVYFVHSYAVKPANPDHCLATTNYGNTKFCSAVRHGNIFGVQFHPEKSGPAGLSMLEQFVNLSKGVSP